MTEQLDLPFSLPSRLSELLAQIDQGNATDLANWCTENRVVDWCWTSDSWKSVVDILRPQVILLGIVISSVSPFWLRSLERFQRDAGVWPLARLGQLGPDDDRALWDSCCVAAFWWSKCRWPEGVRHLLFLSGDPSWMNALLFRWVLPRESISKPLHTYAAWRPGPSTGDLFADASFSPAVLPSITPSDNSQEVLELLPQTRNVLESSNPLDRLWDQPQPPVPSILAHEIRDIMEQACLDRTGILDRLLCIPSFVAVCLDEPSFLFARSARLGLTRVLNSLEAAGLSTIPVVAEVAVTALLHGHQDVWRWAINRPLEDLRHTALMAYQFNWVLPPTDAAATSARWLVDWVCATPGLMNERRWFGWSSHLAQVLLFHQGTMPKSFAAACAVLLEPSAVDRQYVLKALLGPLIAPIDLCPDDPVPTCPALGLVLDSWPIPINDLEEILSPSDWHRLSFHYRVQHVLLARRSGLSGQEDDDAERRGRRRL